MPEKPGTASEKEVYVRWKVVITDPRLAHPNSTYAPESQKEADEMLENIGPRQSAVMEGSTTRDRDDWKVIKRKAAKKSCTCS